MRGFDEVAVVEALDVADVGKGDAGVEVADHLRDVVVGVGAERAAAQGEAVAGAVHHVHYGFEVLMVFDDARQAEDGEGRVVGVDGHFDARLFGGGDDGFEEVFEVFAQIVFGNVFVGVKKAVEVGEAFGFPAGQGQAVRAFFHAFHQRFGVKLFHGGGVVKEGGGAVAVGAWVVEVGAHPVKDGHEVVAHDFDAVFAEVCEALFVVFDVLVAFGLAEFDGFVDVDAFHDVDVQAVFISLCFHFGNARFRPDFACGKIVQRPDDAGHGRDFPLRGQ